MEQLDIRYCRNRLLSRIHKMITNDLTIGREDEDLQSMTIDEINIFINNNTDNIENVINDIIEAFTETDEDIQDLLNIDEMPTDWIGEFLYERVRTLPEED